MLRPALITIADTEMDIAVTAGIKPLFTFSSEFLDDFYGVNLARQLGQNGSLIAKSGADLQNFVAAR